MSLQPHHKPLISGDAVVAYLPQRDPMIVIDTLWEADKRHIVGGFTVPVEHLFVDNGMLTVSGVMEHVAQTAALGAGFGFRNNGEAVKTGFIGSYKDVRILRKPHVGETLITTLTIEQEIWSCTAYQANVYCGEELIATMEMKLFTIQSEG